MSEVLAPEDLLDEDGVPTTDTLTRGTRLGRYELLLPVAMGGMAKVWAARQHGQRGFTKLVAIKTILPHLAEDPAFEHMFLDEARIASGVHHPNVAEIYELGEEGKVLYLAMEWVSGDSLVRVLRANKQTLPIDPRIAVRIVADASAGLHAAHELADDEGRPLGVVHRDVSPHNILLTADGNVKVTDFGVAKAIGQLHDATSSGTLKGKLSYMAPEQVTGTHIDRRTDVFGLGCVLYEATTGKLPYRDRGEGEQQVMQRLIRGQAELPSHVVRGYPPELEAIVMRALASQPIQRFATAERMRVALEEWLVKSGSLVTAAQVAATARARIGPSMDKRRERIRVAMTTTGEASVRPAHANTPSAGTATDSASGVVPSGGLFPRASSQPSFTPSEQPETAAIAPGINVALASEPPPRATTRQYALASAIGVGVALLLGAGALFWWSARHPPEEAVAAAPTTEAPAAPSAPAAAVAVAPPAPSAAPAPAEPIRLQVAPEGVEIQVDGVALPDGTRDVPRPRPGETVTLTLHASGYQDEIVQVDSSTESPLTVELKPADAKPAADPKHRHHNDPIPANPY